LLRRRPSPSPRLVPEPRAVHPIHRSPGSAFRFQNRDSYNHRITHHGCTSELSTKRKKNRLRNGCVLWLRVLALLSHREEGLSETSSQRWPAVLRRRLASALNQHERSSSRSSPFRGRFFRPGLEYIKCFEFRDLSAVRQPESAHRIPRSNSFAERIVRGADPSFTSSFINASGMPRAL
jgi:hypothetical protein